MQKEGRRQSPQDSRRPTLLALVRVGVLLSGLTIHGEPLRAAEPDAPGVSSVADMDLEALVKVRIRIASIDAKPVESQPAVVTVITAEEIEASGAKDLKDILQLVPGFTAGLDVAGAVGPGFRGIWAYEGKVQVRVDGIEMNEGYFGNVFTLDRFAAASIEQVEILRGPGSAMYGGTAEMAVISITTKGAKLDGGSVSERLVFHGDGVSHQVASSAGYRLPGDWAISGSLAAGESSPSDQRYRSPDGAVERDLHGTQQHRPLELNLAVRRGDAEVRVIYHRHLVRDQLLYGATPFVVPQGLPGETENNILAVSAKSTFELTDRLSMSPRAIYRHESPWWMTYPAASSILHRRYQRGDLDLPVTIKVSDSSKAVLGVHYYREYARAHGVAGQPFDGLGVTAENFFFGSDHVARDDVAGYVQYDLDSRWVNLTLGGRYEYYSYSGGTFVPRVGLVKAWDRLHLKVLYNQSFRTPHIGVATDSPTHLKDEFTTTYELEAGVRLGGGFSLTGNAYHVRIENLIAYEGSVNRYVNGAPMSTEGGELQARFRSERLAAYVGYSYSRAVDQGLALYSARPTLRHLNLNMPAHQVVWSASWHVTRAASWNVSGTFLSRRAAFAYPDVAAPSVLDGQVLLHTQLTLHWGQVDLGLGVRDLLDEQEVMGQPYNGGSGPLRLSGRTFLAQLGFRFQDAR